jgi:GNAT superfamily N-acetyltransferase
VIAVRSATVDDADAMSTVLTASITELCVVDHGGRPEALTAWLSNKSLAHMRAMLGDAARSVLVAEVDRALAGVGAVEPAERLVALNYVSPSHRFVGVSTALLEALEAALGPGEARLSSTATALRFYRARGWTQTGETETWRGMTAYPMRKRL